MTDEASQRRPLVLSYWNVNTPNTGGLRRVNALLEAIPMLQPNIVHSNDQHEAIVSAILAGRPQSAAEAMLEHVEGSSALLRGFLTRH